MGEFYKVQQQLHLIGNTVSDRDAPQKAGSALCARPTLHTFTPQGSIKSHLILDRPTAPSAHGRAVWTCPDIAYVGVESVSFFNTHRECYTGWSVFWNKKKSFKIRFFSWEAFLYFFPLQFPPKGLKQYQVRVLPNAYGFIDISMSVRKNRIEADNSNWKLFIKFLTKWIFNIKPNIHLTLALSSSWWQITFYTFSCCK